MRVIHLSIPAFAALLITSPAMACPAGGVTELGCNLPLTIVDVGDGFSIVQRGRLATALPGDLVQGPPRVTAPPLRLGSAVRFDEQLVRSLDKGSLISERVQ